ncbi:MAG TPA: DAK2 domain-containing protein [Acidimicrobiales bacterium]|nr:DAK2 domain-containing protein [Acidimicrobiales bacterium]
MTPLEHLEPGDLKAAVTAYRDGLRAHQDRVNRLNVFPVPDGDTGTNMALTLEAVVTAMDGADDMAGLCKAICHGSLMGARGNSGVILSQILRGIAQRCQGADTIGAPDMAEALAAASEAAYKAVMDPVEGTILTVVKGAAEGAASAASSGAEGSSLLGVLEAAHAAAGEALARTPELLAVLKQAGVVDAGGAGFVLFLDAFLHVVDGRPLPEASPPSSETATAPAPREPQATRHDLGPRYEVMHLLDATDEAVERLKQEWSGLGDSIAVVGGDGTWNCHVHTDDIGAAIEVAIGCGRPHAIRVTDLHEQVEAEHCASDHGRSARPATEAGPTEAPPVTTAVIAVAAGAGLADMFASLGAQGVVSGGQSMNPSTAQLLEAVEAAPSGDVVILPNNPNIVAVAGQVDALSTKSVRVVPTRSVPEGLVAMLEFDPSTPAEANETAMAKAAAQVVSGEVTRAVRASTCDAGPIAEGDWLGLSGKGIQVVAKSLSEAAVALLDRLVEAEEGDADGHEVVTVIEGDGSTPADTTAITDWLAEHRPAVEVEVHKGGQPLYPYLFSIE